MGQGNAAGITETRTEIAASQTLTWEEVEEFGTPLNKLKPGDWFATVLATQDGLGQEEVTGRLVYVGIGSSLVQLDRTWESRIRWQPEAKVIKLDKPRMQGQGGAADGIQRVSLDPATFVDYDSDTDDEINDIKE